MDLQLVAKNPNTPPGQRAADKRQMQLAKKEGSYSMSDFTENCDEKIPEISRYQLTFKSYPSTAILFHLAQKSGIGFGLAWPFHLTIQEGTKNSRTFPSMYSLGIGRYFEPVKRTVAQSLWKPKNFRGRTGLDLNTGGVSWGIPEEEEEEEEEEECITVEVPIRNKQFGLEVAEAAPTILFDVLLRIPGPMERGRGGGAQGKYRKGPWLPTIAYCSGIEYELHGAHGRRGVCGEERENEEAVMYGTAEEDIRRLASA
ncbi:hypothetical protein FB451DRAFT_1164332 [Mycena latifolia]|nr:hypothetical protein FB451DRAFT_1164332 [Mycena latifolia]